MNFKISSGMNLYGIRGRLAVLALSTLLLGSCAAQSGRAQTGLETLTVIVECRNGARVPIEVEAARSEEQRRTGLMYRTELADGKGMLFFFESDQVLSFWMENTLIPLSIAYISYDGKIIDIRDMRPRDRSPITSSRSVRYALEVPRGYFTRAGITAGDSVRIP
ncbi:MAG: DUF192 domain-containing protein [Treponema sp.]|jgi:uncharacterized membrane protein (UPF0127 family)|nr:DUF192 domain-containing protein [Treponema sp.]